ncbi:MAG: hypothetical protein LBU75_12120 [Desulfovibrio sp.]|jgi:hypothetical protein|nr:hypothetical protein [Desulfovibrio sp.]
MLQPAASDDMLLRLSAERKLKTTEQFEFNDFYGHATILKRHVKLPRALPLRVIIEHGSRIGDTNWDAEINAPYFIYFCWSPERFDTIRGAANKACFALGPMIQYVPGPRPERLAALAETYGRNLLFFPSHSTHWVDNEYDVSDVCARLHDIGKQFDTVRVCVYWRDIQRGLHRKYLQEGFSVHCAGHIYDANFYSRLREIMESATVIAAMTPGSCMGHGASLGKPYFHLSAATRWHSAHDHYFQKIDSTIEEKPITRHIAQLFGELRDDITPEQRAFLATLFGIDHRKTPEELRRIFQLGEDIWSLSQATAPDGNRLLALMLLAKALEAHHAGNRLHLLRFAEQAVALAPDLEHRALDIIQSSPAHPGA